MAATEKEFYQDADEFVEELLEEAPVAATQLGDHRYDDRLPDYSAEAMARQRKIIGQWRDTFEEYDTGGWSTDALIDRTLMVQLCKQLIRGYDALRTHERDPGEVVGQALNGVYLLIVRDFAPLPERMKSILGRARHLPRLLDEGRRLIKPADVPPVWAQIALETTRQSIGLFTALLPRLAEETPELKADVLAAVEAASIALNAHAEWIEGTVTPQAAGEFPAGRELFNEILREDHMVDYDATELEATGRRLIEETAAQMSVLAREMDPDKTVDELIEASKANHPAAGELLDVYRREMEKARQVVIDRKIATLPAGEHIRIEPTPAFLRPIIPYAAYMMPGFLEKDQEGIFVVTPVGEDADPEAAEQKLRGHPLASIPVTALHEAYPGHHLQLTFANQVGSLPRKLGGFLSTLFIEGWAFYCEELMEELGYIDQPIQKLARLQAQLWRAARIVLDVSLHTGEATVEEAIDFLVEQAGLEPADATGEVRRYTQSPTQPQSYLMGKLEILEIIDEYKRRHPGASLREMHDAILGCGSLPPRLMRLSLFGAQE
jgi:uncharacterized protein (DUF885 family)